MPFKPGHTYGLSGRPKKSALWKKAEDDLRKALPYMLRMTKSQLADLMSKDPTGAEIVAYKFMSQYPAEVIDRFLPSAWAEDPQELFIGVPLPMQQEIASEGLPSARIQ